MEESTNTDPDTGSGANANSSTSQTTDPDSTNSTSFSFDAIIEKDVKLERLLLDTVKTVKRMHELKFEIKNKQNEYDEDRTKLLKSMYLTLHTEKLSHFNQILKAIEETL